ncbi:MAG TPA: hypothetical protein VMR45_01470 [Patescibacteria group bacterium]|nr:hypothetical protein [Patescibacteria group bacterium]
MNKLHRSTGHGRIHVRAIRREHIDIKRLAQILVRISEEELKREKFIESLKKYDSRVDRQELDGCMAARLGDHFFILFYSGMLTCRLPKEELTKALKVEDIKESTYIREWAMLPEDADEALWKKYALIALRYAAEQTDTNADPPITARSIWMQDIPKIKYTGPRKRV